MDLAFNFIGHPTYGVSFRGYEADIPLSEFSSANAIMPLFVIPKGSTIVSVKAFVSQETKSGNVAIDIGTYGITSTGGIGAAIDGDALFDGITVTSSSAAGAVLAKAATANGLQVTQDVLIQAAGTVTVAATDGIVHVEVITLP